jgi:hypothetical protein
LHLPRVQPRARQRRPILDAELRHSAQDLLCPLLKEPRGPLGAAGGDAHALCQRPGSCRVAGQGCRQQVQLAGLALALLQQRDARGQGLADDCVRVQRVQACMGSRVRVATRWQGGGRESEARRNECNVAS